ncbi:MAG: phosphoribosyltransferase family protein [Acidimicrobiia bacterium]|nr:phosphoribosyltransferase family protein [Acidimicrobiia bacterium]
MDRYRNRREAGRVLTQELENLDLPVDTIVLGLPRGGAVCAAEVAAGLGVRLDLLLVRKLGVPSHPEVAFGAIASGGFRVLNASVAAALSDEEVEQVVRKEVRELDRRVAAYGVRALSFTGRCVVIVDDGLATGATMRVAIEAARSQRPDRIIAAVPVAAAEAVAMIRPLVDDLVCPLVPSTFRSVGEWYLDFVQVTDAEVIRLMAGD